MCPHGTHRKSGGRDHMRHQNALLLAKWLSKPLHQLLLFLACMICIAKVYKLRIVFDSNTKDFAGLPSCAEVPNNNAASSVLVSYSYYQKDDIQRSNFEFFMAVGMGISSGFHPPNNTEFVLVINGDVCDPCTKLLPYLGKDNRYKNLPDIKKAWSSADVALLERRENEGMDFAAHNVSPLPFDAPISSAKGSNACKRYMIPPLPMHADHYGVATLDGAVAQVPALYPAEQLSKGPLLPVLHGPKLAVDACLHRPSRGQCQAGVILFGLPPRGRRWRPGTQGRLLGILSPYQCSILLARPKHGNVCSQCVCWALSS